MAVVLSVESGFDHEDDLDVLRSLFRLGLRGVQFATQTSCNAFADSSIGSWGIWGGINSRGRELVKLMNELGILIDLTHASQETQIQVIAANEAPVVASHVAMEAVSGDGTPNELMPDEVLRALSAKGGMVGIIGVSARLSKGYRDWPTFAPWEDQPESANAIPTTDDWASHVAHVLRSRACWNRS